MFDWTAFEELGHKVAGLDARAASDGDLFDAALALERVRAQIDAAQGSVLAELDARGACDREFGLHANQWLAGEAHLARSTATARLKVGRQLARHLPATRAALAEGRISWDHARLLADAANPRIADQLTAVEDRLVALADGMTFQRWAAHVRDLARLIDEDGGYDPTQDVERNTLHLTPCTDGMTYLKGTLIGVGAEAARQAIERVADELAERYRRDAVVTNGELPVPPRATLRALALLELIRRANAAGDPGVRGPSPEVTLVIGADDVADDGSFTGASTPDGVRLQTGHLCGLSCDASIFPIVVDALGVPLDMGREIRTANRAQRRALALRDGGCTFPHCDAPPEACQAHHIDHWVRDHGMTDVDAMALGCTQHHPVIHRAGWTIELTPDGWTIYTSPNGRRFYGQRHGRQRAGEPPPRAPDG